MFGYPAGCRSISGFIWDVLVKYGVEVKKSPADKAGLFSLMVEAGGIEPPSASPLQIVLHT